MSSLLRSLLFGVLLAIPAPAQQPNEKAARYFDALQKRPAAGPVFDKFVDAWLDSDTLEHLETWLAERAKPKSAAGAHLLLGLFHVRKGAHAKAVEEYRAALQLEPGNPVLWQQKAIAESGLLEFDEAIASLEKGMEQKPADELSLAMRQLLGRLLSRAGRTGDALKVWEKLMAERPDDEALREDVLDLQLAEGLYDAAVQNAAALIGRAPDAYKKAMRRLQSGDVLDRAGRPDKALVEWEQCLADSGADSWLEKEVLARMGRLFRRDDNLTGLRAHLETLAQRQPQRQGLQRARVRLLAEMGEKSAAVDAGRALLATAPGDRTMRDDFIALLVEAGRLDEAVAQTNELVRQTPQDRELLLRLASLRLQAGDKAGCLSAVTEFERLSGADEASRLRSAALLEKAGLAAEAIARLQAAAQEIPNSAVVSHALASALHKARRRDEALAEWKRQAAAASGAALQELARALSAHGEGETAWEMLHARVAPDSGDGPLLTQLCQLAETLDRADEAMPHVRHLVSLAQSSADMDAALELASRLIKRAGQTEDVITSLQANETAGPADLCLLAELLEQRGDSVAAEAALRRASQAAPELAAAQMVRLFRVRQAWAQALEAGMRLFNAPGGRKAATAQMLADLAERARDLEEALKWTREWRKLSPGAAPAVLAEARVLRALGKDDESLKTLRLASGQFEENREIRWELARASRDAGNTTEALSLYAGLYEQAPDNEQKLRVVHEWATAAQDANRLPETLEQFEERRRQNRTGVGPLLALVEIHAVNGDRASQQRVLTEAARLRPEDADLALTLASMQEADDLIPVAIETLQSALPHDKSGRVRQRLARLHLTAGDPGVGMRLLEESSAGGTPDAAAVESMVLSLADSEPDRAFALLRPRVLADPDDYRLRFLLAMLLAESGRDSEALREWSALMIVKHESPSVTARRTAPLLGAEMENRINQLTTLVPEDVLLLLRIHELRFTASRNWQYGTSSQPSQSARRLPGTIAELQALTAFALVSSFDNAPDGIKASAESVMQREGVEAISKVLPLLPDRSLFSSDPNDRDVASATLSGAAGDAASGLGALVSLLSTGHPANGEVCRRVWRTWHRTHPEFALAAGLAGLQDGGAPQDWEVEVVEMLQKVKRPSALLLSGAARYFARGGVRGWDSGRTHGKLMEQIASWLAADWMAAPNMIDMRQGLAGGIIKSAAADGQAELLARVLSREWLQEGKTKMAVRTSSVPPSSPIHTNGEEGFLDPLVWPLLHIPGVSPIFAGGGALNHVAGNDARTAASLVPHATLRAWLEDLASGADHPLPSLTKLAAEPGADAAALALAAVSMAEAEKYEEAAALAMRALERPLPADCRHRLNVSLLSWAEENMAASGSPLYNAAREAALRLRRDAQTFEEKMALVEAMQTLGLGSEAAAFSARGTGGLPGRFSVPVYGGSAVASRRQASLQMLDKALQKPDSDGGVVMAAKLLRRQARFILSPPGWVAAPNDQPSGFLRNEEPEATWPSVLRRLKDTALKDRLLVAIDPGSNAEPRLIGIFGAALELLNEKDRAVKTYRRALKAGAVDPGLRVRLVRLLWEQNPDAVTDELAAASPEAQAALIQFFLPAEKREPLERVMGVTAIAIAVLEKNNEQVSAASGWLGRLAVLLREDLPIDENQRAAKLTAHDSREPVHRATRPEAGEQEKAKARQQLAARGKLHDALCRALLRVPGAAALAFSFLQSTAGKGADLTQEAVTACVAESRIQTPRLSLQAQQAQAAQRFQSMIMYGSSSDSAEDVAMPHPDLLLDYVLDAAVKRNSPDILRKSLIPALKAAGSAKMAECVELLAGLYFNPQDQVEEAARRVVAAGGEESWQSAIRGLRHRKATPDLSPLLLSDLTRARTRPESLHVMSEAVEEYCDWLCAAGRHDRARALLGRAVDLLAGPARQRANAISSRIDGGMSGRFIMFAGGGTARGNQSIAVLLAMLNHLVTSRHAVFATLDVVFDDVMPSLSPATARTLGAVLDLDHAPFTRSEFFEDVDRSRAFFRGSPLLMDVEKFHAYGGGTGVFTAVANGLDSVGFEDRLPVLEFLRQQPAAFGRDLMMAAAGGRWTSAAMNAAAPYLDRIKALPPEPQEEIADLLAALAVGRDMANLTDSGRSLLTWVQTQQSVMLKAGTAREVEWFLDPKSAVTSQRGFGNDPSDAGSDLLAATAQAMSPRAYDVVRRTAVLARGSAPAKMGELLTSLCNDEGISTRPDITAFRLGVLTNTLCAADKRAPVLSDELRAAIPKTVRMLTDSLTGTPEQRLTALTQALAGHVKEGEASVLLEAFPLPLTADDTAESRAALRAAAIAWAAGAGKALPRQDIVREIAAAARLEQFVESNGAAGGITDETVLPPEQAHYLAVMRNETLPQNARLIVASILADYAGAWLEPPLVVHATALLEKAITTRRPVEGWQRLAVMRALARSAASPLTDAAVKSLLPRIPVPSLQVGSPAFRSRRPATPQSGGTGNDLRLARVLLKLALRTGDRGRTANLLHDLHETKGDPESLAIVLRSGDTETIRNVLRDVTKLSFVADAGRGDERFDQPLADALNKTVKQLEPVFSKLVIELAVNCLPSAPGIASRKERVQAIAARLPDVMPDLPAASISDAHAGLLDLLTIEPTAALQLRKYYEAAAAEFPLEDLRKRNVESIRPHHLRFWRVLLCASAADADFPKMTERLDALLVDLDASSDSAGNISTVRHLIEGIAHGWPQWDGAKRAAVQQWLIDRMKNNTLTPPDSDGSELSALPQPLLDALNAAAR